MASARQLQDSVLRFPDVIILSAKRSTPFVVGLVIDRYIGRQVNE